MENIIHIDMDAFFASIEQLDNPELKNKPIAVAGKSEKRGVVSSPSYEARKFGIKSAMPVITAKKKCPDLIIVEARFHRYHEISKGIRNIFYKYTPIVEIASIDEAYLDVSGSYKLFNNSVQIARNIKNDTKKEYGLTCSTGIAPNKLLAKIASDYNKPDGLTHIRESEVKKFLDELDIRKLPGIGPKTTEALNKKGIVKIWELKTLSIQKMKSLFGINGERIYNMSRGIDNSKVHFEKREEKSISHETTFEKDTIDKEFLKKILLDLCDKITTRLRKNNLIGKSVKLKLKYSNFTIITKQKTLNTYTDNSDAVYKCLSAILDTIKIKPVRLIGAGISQLSRNKEIQLNFIKNEKYEKFEESIDKLKDQFGSDIIKRASLLDNE